MNRATKQALKEAVGLSAAIIVFVGLLRGIIGWFAP